MSPVRRLLGNLALAGLSAAVCLGLIEAAARLYARRLESGPHTTRGSIVRYHPTLGWDKPPGESAWLSRPEYQVNLAVNAGGLRGPDRPHGKPLGAHRTLLLGDSFVEGYTVAEEQTVRALLERRLDEDGCGPHQVLNAGVMGYSTDQEYLFFQSEGHLYQPDLVVLFFFYNDLYHNTSPEQGKPYFDLVDGRLELRNSPVPPPPDGVQVRRPETRVLRLKPWHGSMALRMLSERTAGSPRLRRALAGWGLVEPDRLQELIPELWPIGTGRRLEVEEMWRRTEAILAALDAEVALSGGRLLLFYVPDHAEVNDAIWEATRRKYGLGRRGSGFDKVFRRFADAAGRLGIPMIAPHRSLRDAEERGESGYFAQDGHWNATGHAVAAGEIAGFLRESAWATCAPEQPPLRIDATVASVSTRQAQGN